MITAMHRRERGGQRGKINPLSSVTTQVHLISWWASLRSRLKQLWSVYRDVPPTIAVGKTWCSSYQKFSRQNWVECRIQSQDLFTCFLFKSKIHTEFSFFLRGAKVSWLFPPFFFSLMQCCAALKPQSTVRSTKVQWCESQVGQIQCCDPKVDFYLWHPFLLIRGRINTIKKSTKW